MILGHIAIDLDRRIIETHRDSYKLDMLSVISVRRPLLIAGTVFASGVGGFAFAFADLLYAHEIGGIALVSTTLLVVGMQVGRLKLLSRDLRGSELSDAIWGHYGRLNSIRRRITWAMTSPRKESS